MGSFGCHEEREERWKRASLPSSDVCFVLKEGFFLQLNVELEEERLLFLQPKRERERERERERSSRIDGVL